MRGSMLIVLVIVLVSLPFIIKLLVKISKKYFKVSDEEVAAFNKKWEYIESNEPLKKSYRNYMFWHFLLGFFGGVFLMILPGFMFKNLSEFLVREKIYIFLPLILLSICGIGCGIVLAQALIYLFNKIFDRKTDLKYYDVFSMKLNQPFEKNYPIAKQMKSLSYLKMSNFIYYALALLYIINLILFYIFHKIYNV